jgi:N-acetyl-gamma-glutamyl-phosphate reductase
MTVRAGVVGASGYMGAELLRLLAGHPEIEVAVATGESTAGSRVADLYPSLTAAYGDTVLAAFDPEALAGLDLVFCALPHGESQKQMGALTAVVPHVIDVGADFRLGAEAYEQWYGEAHQAPELLPYFSFGLVELFPRRSSTARTWPTRAATRRRRRWRWRPSWPPASSSRPASS